MGSSGKITTLLEKGPSQSEDYYNLHNLNIDERDFESISRDSARSANSNNSIFDPNPCVIDRRISQKQHQQQQQQQQPPPLQQQHPTSNLRERSMNFQQPTVRPMLFNITQTPKKLDESQLESF